jgi:hypothetical protein
LGEIMQLRTIIAVGALGLLIACLQESFVALYIACLVCLLMYAFRMFGLAVSGRDTGGDNSGQARPPTLPQLFTGPRALARRAEQVGESGLNGTGSKIGD